MGEKLFVTCRLCVKFIICIMLLTAQTFFSLHNILGTCGTHSLSRIFSLIRFPSKMVLSYLIKYIPICLLLRLEEMRWSLCVFDIFDNKIGSRVFKRSVLWNHITYKISMGPGSSIFWSDNNTGRWRRKFWIKNIFA